MMKEKEVMQRNRQRREGRQEEEGGAERRKEGSYGATLQKRSHMISGG